MKLFYLPLNRNEVDVLNLRSLLGQTYKYFLEWDEQSEDLMLGKMVILRPFATGDGFKRQNWMSSLKFKDKPRLSNR